MAGPDDQADAADDQGEDEFEEIGRALMVRLESFMDEQDIGDDFLSDLLVDAAVHLRMSAYGMDVEKPSVAGLKLDLDRMRQDVEQAIRYAKKDAEGFIARVKEARAEAELEQGGA